MADPVPAPIERLWNGFAKHEPKAVFGGIYAAKPGYHSPRNANDPDDYSVADYPADRQGPGGKASALDLTFSDAQHADYRTIRKYTKRLDRAARRKDKRLYVGGIPVLREFIGTKNGSTVYCWDLQVERVFGGRDESHLWHIHLSITRKFSNRWHALEGVLSVLRGEPRILMGAKRFWNHMINQVGTSQDKAARHVLSETHNRAGGARRAAKAARNAAESAQWNAHWGRKHALRAMDESRRNGDRLASLEKKIADLTEEVRKLNQ